MLADAQPVELTPAIVFTWVNKGWNLMEVKFKRTPRTRVKSWEGEGLKMRSWVRRGRDLGSVWRILREQCLQDLHLEVKGNQHNSPLSVPVGLAERAHSL